MTAMLKQSSGSVRVIAELSFPCLATLALHCPRHIILEGLWPKLVDEARLVK